MNDKSTKIINKQIEMDKYHVNLLKYKTIHCLTNKKIPQYNPKTKYYLLKYKIKSFSYKIMYTNV